MRFGLKKSTDKMTYIHSDGKVQVEQVDILETWKAMEELVDEGYVRAIGKIYNARKWY